MEVVVVLLSVLFVINIQVEATVTNSRARYQPNAVDSKIKESSIKDGPHIRIPNHLFRDGNLDDGVVLYHIDNGTKSFDLHTPILENSEIVVSGEIESDGRLSIILGSASGTVCQVDVFYPVYDQSEDKIETIPKPQDGETYLASDYFPDMTFSVTFKAYKIESQTVSIFIAESHLTFLYLEKSLQDVTFVSSTGHVTDVRFVQR